MANREEVKHFESAKLAYMAQAVSEALDESIALGINRGKRKLKRRDNLLSAVTTLAAALVIFVGGVNYMPTFAAQLEQIPVIGVFVKLVKFNQGFGSGGVVTDGANASKLEALSDLKNQYLILHFEQEGEAKENASHYEIEYQSSPETMLITLSGVRLMSAKDDFVALKGNQYVKEVYPVMTLDDSMVRFMIVFNTSVKYEVSEFKSPASLQIKISPEIKEARPYFRIRTVASEPNEAQAIIEESLGGVFNQMRLLKDDAKEQYYWELGQYSSEIEANKAFEEAKKMSNEPLILEYIK